MAGPYSTVLVLVAPREDAWAADAMYKYGPRRRTSRYGYSQARRPWLLMAAGVVELGVWDHSDKVSACWVLVICLAWPRMAWHGMAWHRMLLASTSSSSKQQHGSPVVACPAGSISTSISTLAPPFFQLAGSTLPLPWGIGAGKGQDAEFGSRQADDPLLWTTGCVLQ